MPTKRRFDCHHGPTNSYTIQTPIGDIEVISCPKGLHSVSQMDLTDENFSPNLRIPVEVKSQAYQDNGYTYKPALLCVEWLKQYFSEGSSVHLKLPPTCSSISKCGTFTEKVWQTLPERVTFGQTISYGKLAQLCGNVKACRAVGMAMRSNPLQLLIPCHRVIQESGGIGNYSSGRKNKMKLWLLKYEGAIK